MNRGPCTNCRSFARARRRSSGVKLKTFCSVLPCRSNAGGLVGNGCVGDDRSRGTVALRHRSFDDGPHRLSRLAVEDVRERLLADLHDGLDPPAVDGDVAKDWSGRKIVVPQTVVNGLEVPDPLAGLCLQAHQALGEQVVAHALPAVVVVGRRRRREVYVVELTIVRHRRPDVGASRSTRPTPRARSRIRTRLCGESCGTTTASRPSLRRKPARRREASPFV